MNYKNGKELLAICKEKNLTIYDVAILNESNNSSLTKEEIYNVMKNNLNIMKNSIEKGLDEKEKNIKGFMIGGEAKKLKRFYENNKSICGKTMSKAISYALSVMEVNVSMGRIVACPTAGSCGVLPAVLLAVKEKFDLDEETVVKGLLTSSAVGIIIGKNACLSGAEGGCQAEVGSASAMAAAAIVEMLGGTPEQALNASAISLKNLMGLICDPVAGLVEAPCAKRNAIGTSNAMISAEMTLAGIKSIIPFDEVVVAMGKVGKMLPVNLRETAEGGIATTPTGRKLRKKIFGEDKIN
ncbi:L-serine ammonia-lyase, iron-sulfur-dependent, subunit alpha [Vallitalea sp.]|jgi:L-serine dehydratase|uniref:L-serine ammonia-lyase, iron-sulfur-dependent, subunit alpha n=1 Tax=Vallitalea sp. TaxID=1882829 RepID=UPI0025EA38F6|nr:L-serine ammonia-lyase, iron-sulfur-dependent, subunit alpha [Vallitalea sp.]MCT4685715.1 L-serine ammonia-lyase, iron-sulfur-dependent, subunit alpha [Vallitalea sp.]